MLKKWDAEILGKKKPDFLNTYRVRKSGFKNVVAGARFIHFLTVTINKNKQI